MTRRILIAGCIVSLIFSVAEAKEPGTSSLPKPPDELTVLPPQAGWNSTPYAQWKNGINSSEDYFPIAVWLQKPKLAKRYKAAGINLYLALWKGPTEEHLADLKEAGMQVICPQNEVGLKHLDDPIIAAWSLKDDEPDNARKFSTYWNSDKEKIKEGWPELYRFHQLDTKEYTWYGPSIPPKWVVERYREVKKNDPSRPVYLGLGQGVSWEAHKGRGERSGHLEDYAEYMKGCDFVTYDIYPGAHSSPDVKDALWYVPQGVRRLREWNKDAKPVWVHIETGIISDANAKPTPDQVKTEVWMALIHGARGIDYFVHQFVPKRNSHALLDNPEMLAAVTALNARIQSLASVINSPTLTDALNVDSSNANTPVHTMVKKKDGATYIFSAAMYDEKTTASFELTGIKKGIVEVIDEDRTIVIKNGRFTDPFAGHEVHLYKIEKE